MQLSCKTSKCFYRVMNFFKLKETTKYKRSDKIITLFFVKYQFKSVMIKTKNTFFFQSPPLCRLRGVFFVFVLFFCFSFFMNDEATIYSNLVQNITLSFLMFQSVMHARGHNKVQCAFKLSFKIVHE